MSGRGNSQTYAPEKRLPCDYEEFAKISESFDDVVRYLTSPEIPVKTSKQMHAFLDLVRRQCLLVANQYSGQCVRIQQKLVKLQANDLLLP